MRNFIQFFRERRMFATQNIYSGSPDNSVVKEEKSMANAGVQSSRNCKAKDQEDRAKILS